MKAAVAFLLAAGFLLASQSIAQDNDRPQLWPEAPADLTFSPAGQLSQSPLEPKLGNGAVADPKQWTATFYGSYAIGQETFSCTSTLIGPRTLLVAAHCIADGGTVSIRRDATGQTYEGKCQRAPNGYPRELSADWALCHMKQEVPATAYERINREATALKRGGTLLLLGFGCRQPGGNSDGKLRYGPAKIRLLPGEEPQGPHWITTYAGKAGGDAFICEGDSGGAVYITPAANRREIVAVNSHRDAAGRGISYLTVLSTTAAQDFITRWRQDNSAQNYVPLICGIDANVPKCRI